MATITYWTIKEFNPNAEFIQGLHAVERATCLSIAKEKSYKEVLKKHYEPKSLVIAEHFHLYKQGHAAESHLELDMGADFMIVSWKTYMYKSTFAQIELQPLSVPLHT